MNVNLVLPQWLMTTAGCIMLLGLLIKTLRLIPNKAWHKVYILLFYRNNEQLYESKQKELTAKHSLYAQQHIQQKQSKQMKKRMNKLKKKEK